LAVLCGTVLLASAYANLSLLVRDPAVLALFPPFQEGLSRNQTTHLGAENLAIAKSLVEGKGFSNPFGGETGPTSWMPPVYPLLLAALLQLCGHDVRLVAFCVVNFQNLVLILTGALVLEAARRSGRRAAPAVALAMYLTALLSDFYLCFQLTHDHWLVLLGVDVLVVALTSAWRRAPSWPWAVRWGALGGGVALVSPVLALVWGVASVALLRGHRRPGPLLLALGLAAALISPWAVRNYLVFGRLIPVKSNLAFELHQSQCLEPDGVLSLPVQLLHPYANSQERARYQALGEMEYLDRRRHEFIAELKKDPFRYLQKVWNRFLATTTVYYPLDRDESGPELWLKTVTHPLPFWALVLLLGLDRKPWSPAKAAAYLCYGAYLLPYVLVSYYERYALPLLGVKVLFCFWAWDLLIPAKGDRRAGGKGQAATRRSGLVLSPRLRYVVFWGAVLAVVAWTQGPSYRRAVVPEVVRRDGGFYVPDFFQEWGAARSALDGVPVYTPIEVTAERYLGVQRGSAGRCFLELNAHPPTAVLLALPLAPLSFPDAFIVWNVLSVWALGASAWLILERLRPRLSAWVLLPAVPCLLLGQPFWHQMVQGQLNLILLLLLTATWAADRSGRPGWAGVFLGVVTAVKLFPGYLILYFMFRRNWRAVGAAVASTLAITALTVAVLGVEAYRSFFLEVLPQTSAFQTTWTNCSLTGLWFKLFAPEKPWAMVDIQPLVASRALAYLGALAGGLASVALLATQIPRARARSGRDLAFALTVAAMLLVSPITWEHYFLLVLLPAAVVWVELPREGLSRDVFWAILFLLSLSPYWTVPHVMTLLGVAYQPERHGWVATPWETLTALSVHCYTLVALFALTAYVLVTGPSWRPRKPSLRWSRR
jgi:hypothetical protein